MSNLAAAYAMKRRSKTKVAKEPIEESLELTEPDLLEVIEEPSVESINTPKIDIASIIKKHRFFASKNDD